MESALILIPILPFLGFLINGLLGHKMPRRAVSFFACAGPAAAAILSLLAFQQVAGGEGKAIVQSLGDWIRAGSLHVPFGLKVDHLSGVMLLVITGVGTLIHVYSLGYMRDDPGYPRFFAYLNLFMAAMLVLVLANNIVLLFLGWEGVGLCSYLLIGFWYKDLSNARAGMKAFVVNRVGDFGFVLGVFLIFVTFGTFEFDALNAGAAAKVTVSDSSTLWWIGILLFVGATGKSAQIPLYVWLPDAMAGPTPVSALIHAATMVTSGIYLLARLSGLFVASGVLPIVATIGALTALLGALIALTQTDIKKVLAYSTVSQLGYMFLGAGVGAFGVAVFHLVTHAFFKALLFLAAGAVIHSLHHEQDMRKMGGLLRKLPITATVFLVGALALSGFPLTAGFFSKDEILHETLHGGHALLYAVGFVTAILTAFYTFRQFCMVFLGEYRGSAHEGHGHHDTRGALVHHADSSEIRESPWVMLGPLVILGLLSLGGGFLDVPGFLLGAAHETQAAGVGTEAHGPDTGKLTGWILGGSAAIVGILAAFTAFQWSPGLVTRLQGTTPGKIFARLSYNKFYVDEAYDLLLVRPFSAVSLILFYLIDRALIDCVLVGGTGFFVRLTGSALRRIQTGRIPTYTVLLVAGVVGLLTIFRWAAG